MERVGRCRWVVVVVGGSRCSLKAGLVCQIGGCGSSDHVTKRKMVNWHPPTTLHTVKRGHMTQVHRHRTRLVLQRM